MNEQSTTTAHPDLEIQDRQRGQVLQSIPAPDRRQVTTFSTDELTAQCPFEFGGPDFYRLTIRYVADEQAVESRSLKEYLETWRDERATAEQIADWIYSDIRTAIHPNDLYIRLEQQRRGGIDETVEVGDIELS